MQVILYTSYLKKIGTEACVICGDTKPLRSELKKPISLEGENFRCWYNKKLRVGPGWVFDSRILEQMKRFLEVNFIKYEVQEAPKNDFLRETKKFVGIVQTTERRISREGDERIFLLSQEELLKCFRYSLDVKSSLTEITFEILFQAYDDLYFRGLIKRRREEGLKVALESSLEKYFMTIADKSINIFDGEHTFQDDFEMMISTVEVIFRMVDDE